MYIKNDSFYFDNKDYIYFNNVKFSIKNNKDCEVLNDESEYYIIALQLYYNYDISSYELHVNFIQRNESYQESYTKFVITKDKYKNKILLLYNLKKIMSIIYDVISLYKQYKGIIKLNNNLLNINIFSKPNKTKNLVVMHKSYNTPSGIYLYTDDNNCIKQNNTILSTEYPYEVLSSNYYTSSKEIFINNNIVYMPTNTIIYPESYNYYFAKKYEIRYDTHLAFVEHNNNFIEKYGMTYYINYYVPYKLLVRFIDNIELFNNINNVYINSEYDLLKYL